MAFFSSGSSADSAEAAKMMREMFGPTGLHRCSDSPGRFTWRLSAEDWQDVALRVAALLRGGSGHQYPDDYLGVSDDVRPMVSMNEYGEEWWKK